MLRSRHPPGVAGRKEKVRSAAPRATALAAAEEEWGGAAGKNSHDGPSRLKKPRRGRGWRLWRRRRKARAVMRRRNVAQAAEARARSGRASRRRKISSSTSSGRVSSSRLGRRELILAAGGGEWIQFRRTRFAVDAAAARGERQPPDLGGRWLPAAWTSTLGDGELRAKRQRRRFASATADGTAGELGWLNGPPRAGPIQ
ncbi:Os10g0135250 [Oryza sativa Japonica Group]|uniref:Os10g0135250 protein n=1 Tax=Oryza sativa subsp. japonica TaxID=39947 RepID=A0A0P0XRB1_ORYSJ|nr:hypothetical protein EE612_049921 [Oryza sativa]BAT09798.1 Os10g0135250 [Oryza sativa Japonica Group]